MEDTYTISKDKLADIFEHLEIIESLRDSYEKEGDAEHASEYFHEWIGRYCTIISLGLLDAYESWQREQWAKKREAVMEA